jgi:hypothetical protein
MVAAACVALKALTAEPAAKAWGTM